MKRTGAAAVGGVLWMGMAGGKKESNTTTIRGLQTVHFPQSWNVSEFSNERSEAQFGWEGFLSHPPAQSDTESVPYSSFFATTVTPNMTVSDTGRCAVDSTIGISWPVNLSLKFRGIDCMVDSAVCGTNDISDDMEEVGENLFMQKTREIHSFEGDPDRSEGLQKEVGAACLNTFSYDKAVPVSSQFTYTMDAVDGTGLRGFLSIEKYSNSYLVTGGIAPDELLSSDEEGKKMIVNRMESTVPA